MADVVVTKALAAVGKGQDSGMCERFTRSCFGFPARYASARLAYEASKKDGPVHKDFNAPAGVPVFWDITTGTNAPYDHVAVSVGGGWCVSTSAGPNKAVARVRIDELTKRWGMTYLGWAEFYHGQRVYSSPARKVSAVTNKEGQKVWSYKNPNVKHGDRDAYALLREIYDLLLRIEKGLKK